MFTKGVTIIDYLFENSFSVGFDDGFDNRSAEVDNSDTFPGNFPPSHQGREMVAALNPWDSAFGVIF